MYESLRKPTKLIDIVVMGLSTAVSCKKLGSAFGWMSERRLLGEIGHERSRNACRKRSCSQVGGKQINTSFIERFNASIRERLAALTRRCRHASQRLEAVQLGMYVIGCTYNLCWVYQQLGAPHPW